LSLGRGEPIGVLSLARYASEKLKQLKGRQPDLSAHDRGLQFVGSSAKQMEGLLSARSSHLGPCL
jgi:hypothetical protein